MHATVRTLGLALCLTLGVGVGPLPDSTCRAQVKSCNVSTEDAVRALYQKLTGKPLHPSDSCIRVSKTFIGLVRIGDFAHDHGCLFDRTIYECQLDAKDALRRAMAAAGWVKADARAREQLALAWIREVDCIDPLLTEPEKWKGHGKTFAPPQASVTHTGGLELNFWMREPAGDQPTTTYRRLAASFAADGTPGQRKQLDVVSIEML